MGKKQRFLPQTKAINTTNMDAILPSSRFKAVTKSDSVAQTYTCESVTGAEKTPLVIRAFRYLYVGVGGDVYLKNDAGNSICLTGVVAGSIIPVNASYVMAATSATNLVAFF